MDIIKLEIKNFLTIGKAEIELDNRGLLLIQGQNNDDPSAISNGAGKSSIVDALCWAIYGVTARGVTADEVVNDTAKKDCEVVVSITDATANYIIRRYRKHATMKNQVTIHQAIGITVTDLSKGTDRETQEVINQVMGCSLDVFVASIYAGQERMPDLPGMTDKVLKTLIEEAAGVEALTSAYSLARLKQTAVKTMLDGFISNKSSAVTLMERAEAGLLNTQAESAFFESGRKDRAKAELAKSIPNNAAIRDMELEVAANPVVTMIVQIEELDEKLKEQAKEKSKQADLSAKYNDFTYQGVRLRAQAENLNNSLKLAEKKLADIDDHVGKPCGECGKEYHEEDMKEAKRLAASAIEAAKLALRPALLSLKSSVAHTQLSLDALNKFTDTMTDFKVVVALQRTLCASVSAIKLVEHKIEALRKENDNLKALANIKLTETNAWKKAIEMTQKEVAKCKDAIEGFDLKIKATTAEFELIENAVRVFGPAGVRAHILDTVTPFLNERTQEYLGALADGNIHAEWSTLTKTAKGDVKEKFNIEVVNDKGGKSFASLSGGEKRKVRLATAMALQDMVASRATKPIGLFIGDEIDDALDDAGLERLMGVLERKAKERGTVLIVSHNSLADWCDQSITVTKDGGYATITGDTHRIM